MIEKKIHYCWFGGKPLDALAEKCLESWKKFFPDYEIIRWDESNFDINQLEFMSQANKHKKWAFISDVARLIVVYENGGIYFDTDVEVISSFDDIVSESPNAFFGLEREKFVSSGLGFGAEKGHWFLKELIDRYKEIDFESNFDNLSDIACPMITMQKLNEDGFELSKGKQKYKDICLYPSEYFSPMDFYTGKIHTTKNTHSIHWYGMSWLSEKEQKDQKMRQRFRKIFGKKIGSIACDAYENIKREGFIKFLKNKLKR